MANGELVGDFVRQGLRIDGRAADQSRPFMAKWLRAGSHNMSLLRFSLGDTTVHVKVVAKPYAGAATEQSSSQKGDEEGFFTVSVSWMPTTFERESKVRIERELQLSRILSAIFYRNRVVDTKTLVLHVEGGKDEAAAAEGVWSISAHVSVVNDDGNVVDCASLGLLLSLFHFKIAAPCGPSSSSSSWMPPSSPKPSKSLSLKYFPITTTFAIFPQGPLPVLMDPTGLEETECQHSLFTVCVDATSKDITACFKEGAPLDPASFIKAADLAYIAAIDKGHFLRSALPQLEHLT